MFYGNTTCCNGGAIYHAWGGACNNFSGTTFTANSSVNGPAFSRGGAIYFGAACTSVFQSCTFFTNSNTCNNNGGGGAISGNRTVAGGLMKFTSCIFSNNTNPFENTYGGGAIFYLGTLDLSGGNNLFQGNTSAYNGGAIWQSLAGSSNIFKNTAFVANSSGQNGGAIYLSSASTNQFINCTFFTNRATGASKQGGAVYNTTAGSVLNVTNCIFWGNTSTSTGTNIYNGGTLNLAYCDIATNANAVSGGTINFGSGIINTNPLFAGMSAPYDVHLQSQYGRWASGGWGADPVNSPCIDAGDPACDYSLEPLPNGGRIDMGAYGNTPQASRSQSSGPVFSFQ